MGYKLCTPSTSPSRWAAVTPLQATVSRHITDMLPTDIWNIILKRVWFLNVRDRLAAHLLLRPKPVWQGADVEGTAVVITIPGQKSMKLVQRDSSWTDLYFVKQLDHFICILTVCNGRVRLCLFQDILCGYSSSLRPDRWSKCW